ncbi:MAG: M48 family metalloprotease [Candidatus Marinimicrobia bacterium]|nr:M48 family metalloprotease [Candidatus Neomarinimicrobiota bacterium]
MKKLLIVILLLTLIISAEDKASIRQDNTHFRQGPGSYYPLIGVLVKEAIVTILSETSGWVKIRAQTQEGWISKNALSSSERESSSIKDNSFFQSSQPTLISKASASGAVKGFAQTYLQNQKVGSDFLSQYDVQFFQPTEYDRFRRETYQNRNVDKINRRYRHVKIENTRPEINSYMEKMGFAVAAQIANGGLDTDVQQLKYLNMVGNLVIENTPLYYYPFKFYILSDSRPVAYAAPNGIIFISKGLLNIIRNEAELACVLGHEIAHVVQQHGYAEVMKRSTQVVAEDAFTELEAESPAEFSDAELDQMAFQMFEAATSRRQTKYETEADMLGVIYAYRAGYEPAGLPAVLGRIKTMTDRDFWHPESNWQYDAIEGRVEAVNEFIKNNLSKNPEWNVTNSRRFAVYIR